MQSFKINDNAEAVCVSENTRSGFRHVAHLLIGGREILRHKVCYQNRTWERWTFQTVLAGLLEKAKKEEIIGSTDTADFAALIAR